MATLITSIDLDDKCSPTGWRLAVYFSCFIIELKMSMNEVENNKFKLIAVSQF